MVALSYYPELKNLPISIEYSDEKTTIASRPSAVFPRRKYKITINNRGNFEGIPFDSIPYNAAVGITGHELAHIVDDEKLTSMGLLDRLLLYVNKSQGRAYFEKVST